LIDPSSLDDGFVLERRHQPGRTNLKKLIVAVAMCLVLASNDAAFGQSGRVWWDSTWVVGWEKGTGVQVIFAGDTLIGFYLRDDEGEAILARTPRGGVQFVVHEPRQPRFRFRSNAERISRVGCCPAQW
jgi:hypothetical protein